MNAVIAKEGAFRQKMNLFVKYGCSARVSRP